MKRISSYLIFAIVYMFTASTSLRAGVIDELSYVPEKSDIHLYFDTAGTISFLKKKGVNIADLDELAMNDSGSDTDKMIKDFGFKLSDIDEMLFAGHVEDFEKKGGFLIFISVRDGKGRIPDGLKKKPVNIKGLTLYEVEAESGILITRIGDFFLIGSKDYIEPFIDNRNIKKRSLSVSGAEFVKNGSGKTIYFRLSVSKYIKDAMDKTFQQGAVMAKGLNENVFIKSLLNLQSAEYGVKIEDKIYFFSGMQGASPIDSERLMMVSHFMIVGSSFVASFADMIAARSDDPALGEVTRNSEFISSLQQIFGRMTTKQVNNGVVVSFYMNEKETDSFIAMIKKGIAEEKKTRAARKESEKISAVTKAISENDSAAAELLLKDKININGTDLDGNTILSTAALMGNLKLVNLALTKGADINLKTSEGMTPLHSAAKGGNAETVKFLIGKKGDVNARSENDMTPLHYNSQQGNAEVTKLLVSAGADVNALALDGSAPAHLASSEGYLDIIKVLAEKKADFTIQDGNMERAVDIAARNNHTAIVDFFKQKYNLEPAPAGEEENYSDGDNSGDEGADVPEDDGSGDGSISE